MSTNWPLIGGTAQGGKTLTNINIYCVGKVWGNESTSPVTAPAS